MAKHSYTIIVQGLDTLHSVGCVFEWLSPVTMNQTAPEKWEGTINALDVDANLDYEIVVRAGGRVKFTYVITNTGSNKEVASGSDHTNLKIKNGAIVRGNCKPD